jgi:hypothetical protein
MQAFIVTYATPHGDRTSHVRAESADQARELIEGAVPGARVLESSRHWAATRPAYPAATRDPACMTRGSCWAPGEAAKFALALSRLAGEPGVLA